MVAGYDLITGVMAPLWVFFAIVIVTLVAQYLGSILRVENLGRVVAYSSIIQIAVVIVASVYVILKTPYNSFIFLNPTSGPGGFSGIALGASIAGFLTFTGYGSPLFYSEEGKASWSTVWKSVIVGLVISVAVGSIAVYAEVAALSNISYVASSPIPLLTAFGPYFGTIGLLFFWAMWIPTFYLGMPGMSAAQNRLVYSMVRDNFIKIKWLGKLDEKGTPKNAGLFNFAIGVVITIVIGIVLIQVYGYNINTLFYLAFSPFTTAVIVWYFHHIIPELGLYRAYRKYKIKVSLARKITLGIIVPIVATIVFLYAFYEGIISDLAEPYFAFVLMGFVALMIDAVYIVIKAIKKEQGKSVIADLLLETQKEKEGEVTKT